MGKVIDLEVERLKKEAKEKGLDLTKATVIDPAEMTWFEEFIEEMEKKDKN